MYSYAVVHGPCRNLCAAPYNHTKFLYRQMVSEFLRFGGVREDVGTLQPLYTLLAHGKREERDAAPYILTRTRCINDWIAHWISSLQPAQCQQIVLLGAGYDTRAYYLPCLARTAVFEVDTLELVSHKNSILPVRMPHSTFNSYS
uniref:Uncharacterized protein n=2 Tax=Lygus hesperus TaxID=30085 RepID=A0A146KY47_LYGHE